MEDYLYDDLYNLEETHWWHKSKQTLLETFVKRYLKAEHPVILDVGCGTGKTLEILNNFGEAFGIDSSKHAISYCKKRGLNRIEVGSSYKIPFNPRTFDLLILLDVLEHTDENKTLKEANRVLKKGGLIIITVPAHQSLWSQWDIVLHHKKRYKRKELIEVLNKNGFTQIKTSYMYSFLVLPVIIVRFIKSIFFKEKYPSDFLVSTPIINSVLKIFSDLEREMLFRIDLPTGTSLFSVARKN